MLNYSLENSLTDNIDHQLKVAVLDGISFVRNAGVRCSSSAEIDRIASLLRLIAERTPDAVGEACAATASFQVDGKYILITGKVLDDGKDHFRIQVSSSAATQILDRRYSDQFEGVGLMSACGYGVLDDGGGDYVCLMPIPTTATEFTELAAFVFGLFDLLFARLPADAIDIDFFVNCQNASRAITCAGLPPWIQGKYAAFKVRICDAMGRYHWLMSLDDGEPFTAQSSTPYQVCMEMQSIVDEYPSLIATLEDLGQNYARFLTSAENQQTEVAESLYLLRGRYRNILFN